jgi:hypothetical protein
LEEHSTEDMVFLEAVQRVFPDYMSELNELGRHTHLAKQSETRPVMKMVMIWAR